MPSFTQVAAFAGLASLAVASPIAKAAEKRASSFRVDQVATGHKQFKSGSIALAKAYQKFGKTPPTHVAAAAAAADSGSAEADPQANDESYLVQVDVGGTTLALDFDTGSSDLWVFSSELPSSESSGHSVYTVDPSKKEQGESWNISYGDKSGASGDVYADTVVVGGVTATSQAVEAATSVSSQFVSDTNNDGLLGLAFSSINTVTPDQATTFFDTVKADLDSPLFCADLKAGAPGSYDFGYIDSSKYQGDLDYTPVDNSQGFWSFTADGYSIGGGAASGSSLTGIADTGTTLLLTDDSIVSAYYAQVSGSENSSADGGYVFPCSTTPPDFALIIDGNAHTVPGSYINYAPTDNTGTTCFGGIQSDSGIGFSIFGDIFLKSQYVVFDSNGPQLGFGQQTGVGSGSSSGNSTGSGSGTPPTSNSTVSGSPRYNVNKRDGRPTNAKRMADFSVYY